MTVDPWIGNASTESAAGGKSSIDLKHPHKHSKVLTRLYPYISILHIRQFHAFTSISRHGNSVVCSAFEMDYDNSVDVMRWRSYDMKLMNKVKLYRY